MAPAAERIIPLDPKDYNDEQAAIFGTRDNPIAAVNLARVLVQHPAVFKNWSAHAMQLGLKPTLPWRDREFIVLRTIELTNDEYEAVAHIDIARRVGLSDAEAAAAKAGTGLPAWEQTLVTATDELVKTHTLSDKTWAALAQKFTPEQMIEVVYCVAMYMTTGMLTNALGIKPDLDRENAWKPPIPAAAGQT